MLLRTLQNIVNVTYLMALHKRCSNLTKHNITRDIILQMEITCRSILKFT